MKNNLLMLTDSYKLSHPWQYPKNMIGMFDYAEARSNKVYDSTVFVGLQGLVKEYLLTPITIENIIDANNYAHNHGTPFNIEEWNYILKQHNGFLPVEIKAVKEGALVPTGNVLFTIESTDEKVPWVVSFLETLLMKVWYPSNIATRSYYVRKMITKYWSQTVEQKDHFGINFTFHNFGDRGSSSVESAAIGGFAHLTQFLGTDNFNSLDYCNKYYNEPDTAGFSIPATEHSTTTSWGKESELDMIMNHLEFNKEKDTIAAVCDSYDYCGTVDAVTSGEFKKKIESEDYPKFIIRPDSGEPVRIVSQTLSIMEENKVTYTTNELGFKEFTKYGIIWGDGIDMVIMENILTLLSARGYAASNIAFGSGGWLMQQHDRDTQGWAVKCSQVTLQHEGAPSYPAPFQTIRDVFKDPLTGPSKKSKKGKLTLWHNESNNEYFINQVDYFNPDPYIVDALQVVYRNGKLFNEQSLQDIRERSAK